MKKFLAVLLVLAILAVLVAACGGDSECPECPGPKTIVEQVPVEPLKPLVFTILNGQHPVVRLMRLGFLDACADLQAADPRVVCEEVLLMEPDIDGYVSKFELVGTMDARAAVVYNDNDALIAAAEKLTAIMPTVSFHMPFAEGESPNTAWVSADTTAYAVNAARKMGEKMGGVGVVARSISAPNGVEDTVMAAFEQTMANEFPNITVLPVIYEGLDLNAAIAIAASQIQAHPEITAAFSSTGNGATTWATALRDAGYEAGKVIVVGMDYTPQNLELIKSGEVWAVVGQPLVEEVYKATVLAHLVSLGVAIDEQNYLPAPFVTIDTVDKYLDYSVRSMEN